MLAERGSPHGLKDTPGIDAGDMLQGCVHEHRNSVIANHAVVVGAPELPYRQIAIGIVLT